MSEKIQRGIQSVEIAAEILEALLACGSSKSLKEIAAAAQISSAKAFPYLISLVRAGLVSKDEQSGTYSAGALAMELGILGLHYLSPQREGEQVVRTLSESTGHGVALSIWGNRGPTVISCTEPAWSLYTEIRLGSVMPLADSSIGRTFSAWMSADLIDSAWETGVGRRPSDDEREAFRQIREAGMSMQQNIPVPDISSASVPVFELSGAIHFVLTLFDETPRLDLQPASPALALLRQQAALLSASLGCQVIQETGTFRDRYALGEQPDSRLKNRAK